MTPVLRPLAEAALERLDDGALIEYMRQARASGDPSAATALAILVFGHWQNVERRVRMKVPPSHVEDLTGDIVADAVASAFEGRSVGEFMSWLSTITRRSIADFYRRGPGRMKPAEAPPAEPAAPSEAGVVAVNDAIERVMGALRDDHRRVVDIVVFEDRPAAEAARAVDGMSEANVHQIVSRFRAALRGELEAGGDTG